MLRPGFCCSYTEVYFLGQKALGPVKISNSNKILVVKTTLMKISLMNNIDIFVNKPWPKWEWRLRLKKNNCSLHKLRLILKKSSLELMHSFCIFLVGVKTLRFQRYDKLKESSRLRRKKLHKVKIQVYNLKSTQKTMEADIKIHLKFTAWKGAALLKVIRWWTRFH